MEKRKPIYEEGEWYRRAREHAERMAEKDGKILVEFECEVGKSPHVYILKDKE